MAASSGKVGFVLLVNGELCDWGLSIKASKSAELATKQLSKWLDRYQPDMVITEKLMDYSRKSPSNQQKIQALAQTANASGARTSQVERIQRYANKYEEIEALAERYPQIANWAPKGRKVWEAEPRNTVLFEALSLIEELG